jgi:transposase
MVLLSAQGMDAARIAEVTFTSPHRVRDVIHNFNADGFDALYPRYRGGRPPSFTLPERQQIKRIALSRPTDHDLPFSTWSVAKLADFLVAEGVVEDISHEGLRALLRDEGVSFERLKTFTASNDPDVQAIADGHAEPGPDDPTVVICIEVFGPLAQHRGLRRRARAPLRSHARDPEGPLLPRGADRPRAVGPVATEYRNLVAKTREIAGGIIKRSWNEEPITSDSEMHSPEIAEELSALKQFEDGYINAVAGELGAGRGQ